ncbi:MAG: hypothetical protein ACKOAH_11975, partial [Pirellula sp.]
MQKEPQAAPKNNNESNERVLSIDALRGFDMFWIMGADTLAQKLLAVENPATVVAGTRASSFCARVSAPMIQNISNPR